MEATSKYHRRPSAGCTRPAFRSPWSIRCGRGCSPRPAACSPRPSGSTRGCSPDGRELSTAGRAAADALAGACWSWSGRARPPAPNRAALTNRLQRLPRSPSCAAELAAARSTRAPYRAARRGDRRVLGAARTRPPLRRDPDVHPRHRPGDRRHPHGRPRRARQALGQASRHARRCRPRRQRQRCATGHAPSGAAAGASETLSTWPPSPPVATTRISLASPAGCAGRQTRQGRPRRRDAKARHPRQYTHRSGPPLEP